TIPVKGEPPRVVRLEFTEHGPIVAEDSARGRAFVVRFVGSEPGTAGYLAQLSIDRATDWRSFLSAAARWRLPTENLVYADVDGHIGWIAAGLMPVRSWSGLLPVPGDGRYEWQGFLRPDELPQSYDPASGMIVTANNNILPPGYARALNYDWAPPYRAHRIARMLGPGARLTVEDFERLQLDEYSLPPSERVPVPLVLGRAAPRGVPPPRRRRVRPSRGPPWRRRQHGQCHGRGWGLRAALRRLVPGNPRLCRLGPLGGDERAGSVRPAREPSLRRPARRVGRGAVLPAGLLTRARGAGDGARAHLDAAPVTKLLDTMRQRSSAPPDRLPPGQVLTTKWPVLHYGN